MKTTILSTLLVASLSLFAQNNFHGDIKTYGHNYKSVVNTDTYAKWVLDGEKTWYLAPDSCVSQLMTDAEWVAAKKQLKVSGFNEIDSKYFWNPKTKTVVMVIPERHKKTGLLHVSTEYGTDIK
jgi:hypothetical protein